MFRTMAVLPASSWSWTALRRSRAPEPSWIRPFISRTRTFPASLTVTFISSPWPQEGRPRLMRRRPVAFSEAAYLGTTPRRDARAAERRGGARTGMPPGGIEEDRCTAVTGRPPSVGRPPRNPDGRPSAPRSGPRAAPSLHDPRHGRPGGRVVLDALRLHLRRHRLRGDAGRCGGGGCRADHPAGVPDDRLLGGGLDRPDLAPVAGDGGGAGRAHHAAPGDHPAHRLGARAALRAHRRVGGEIGRASCRERV